MQQHCLRAVVEAELLEDARDVRLHSRTREVELGGDLVVRPSARDDLARMLRGLGREEDMERHRSPAPD